MSLRFNIYFQSRNDTNCLIEIYDIRYPDTEPAVTISADDPNCPFVPAAQPITIEEKDSSDLLDVIRPKTGYLTLVEMHQGYLNSLYPETNDQCQVRVYYDSNLVFFGYNINKSYAYSAANGILADTMEFVYEKFTNTAAACFFRPCALYRRKHFPADRFETGRPPCGAFICGIFTNRMGVLL